MKRHHAVTTGRASAPRTKDSGRHLSTSSQRPGRTRGRPTRVASTLPFRPSPKVLLGGRTLAGDARHRPFLRRCCGDYVRFKKPLAQETKPLHSHCAGGWGAAASGRGPAGQGGQGVRKAGMALVPRL